MRGLPGNEAQKGAFAHCKSPTGQVAFDRIGKAPGRGAYVCRSAECLKKAVKTKALERALEFKMEDGVLSQLTEQIEAPAE